MFLFALFPVVLPAVAIVVAVTAVIGASKKDRERSEVWARWAAARGWGYLPMWPQMTRAHVGGPFGRGGSRRADRGFWGNFDRVPVFGFRYRYTVSNGKSSQTYTFLVAGVRFPGTNFPSLSLKRESGILFGRDKDLQFENQQFNETWHVKSASPRFAHDVMHPRAMEYFMGPLPYFEQLWFSGDTLFASVKGDPDPLHVDAHLRMLTKFVSLLPAHMLRELRAQRFTPDLSGPGVRLEEQQRRMRHLEVRWAHPRR